MIPENGASVRLAVLLLGAMLGCASCKRFDVPRDTSGAFASCCGGLGTCIPGGLYDGASGQLPQDSCAQALVCAPNGVLNAKGAPPFTACRARGTHAEGRCLPECLPDVQRRAGQLTQDDCAAAERCVPCFDPLTGASTGACGLPGDPGPVEPPSVLAACCNDAGRCVPDELVSAADRVHLGRAGCSETSLCAPRVFVEQTAAAPASCTVSAWGGEGRCLPACLPEVGAQASRLAQDGCATGELCMPCIDPTTGNATHACELGADRGPQKAPVSFEACCDGEGLCVPDKLVPGEQRAHLGNATCSQPQSLCAPKALLDPAYAPARCTVSALGAEGRCLQACLPEAAKLADRFTQDDCASHQICLPCFDPMSGAPTGACGLGADPGPSTPAVKFASCGEDQGRCVPQALVSASDRERLGPDTCAGLQQMCVPTIWLSTPVAAPEPCTIQAYGGEGRCLPNFLPQVVQQAAQLTQESCAAAQSCVPCFHPITGEATGACTAPGDPGPSHSPVTFPGCCGDIGRCVPSAFVPADLRPRLATQECTSHPDLLCVAPAAALTGSNGYRPQACHDDTLGAEGRCLPACLPQVAMQARQLRQGECPSSELCVPCFDPFTGDTTGACTQSGDAPRERPFVFERCCGAGDSAQGVCVPQALLPNPKPQLASGNCQDSRTVCVPLKIATNFNDVAQAGLDSCTSLSGRGACMNACFIDPLQSSLLTTSTCSTAEKCVPCSLDGSPTGVCAR